MSAFIKGMIEFRSCVTSRVENIEAYDWGREIMNRLTFRLFDPCNRQ